MKHNFTLIYPQNNSPISVRDLLNKLLIPRKWQHLLRINKDILINKKYRNFNELIISGDIITFDFSFLEKNSQNYSVSGRQPEVVYEDENVLVINKPKGQKTHPNLNENNTALNDCATYLKHTPYIVHRLDMLTGGLLLVAKNPVVVPILNRQLISKTFKRDYIAIVDLNEDIANSGTIDNPIGKDPTDQRKRRIDPNGARAITHYQIITKDISNHRATLKISLETGRTHQIRVHLASIGCPIVGDPLYNSNYNKNDELGLIAYKLTFTKPFNLTEEQTIILDNVLNKSLYNEANKDIN